MKDLEVQLYTVRMALQTNSRVTTTPAFVLSGHLNTDNVKISGNCSTVMEAGYLS